MSGFQPLLFSDEKACLHKFLFCIVPTVTDNIFGNLIPHLFGLRIT
jgi:hypothetical protein